jgi:hypothetical protein
LLTSLTLGLASGTGSSQLMAPFMQIFVVARRCNSAIESVRDRGSSDTQNISEEVFPFFGSRRRKALRNFYSAAQANECWDDPYILARVGA